MKEKEAIEICKKIIQQNNEIVKQTRKNKDVNAIQLTANCDNESLAISTVLQLIEKQKEEIGSLCYKLKEKICFEGHTQLKQLKEEIEKKNKRTLDLEFVLMDMVLQFADENKEKIGTMGLSALELAFNELDFDNPMSIKEVHKRYEKLAQEYYK